MKYLASLVALLVLSLGASAQCANGNCSNRPTFTIVQPTFTVIQQVQADPINSAQIVIHLPAIMADDVLLMNGVPTSTVGTVRSYNTPTLTPGKEYTYDLEVKVIGSIQVGHTITVKAGYTTEVFSLTDASLDKVYVSGSAPTPGPVSEVKLEK